MIFKNDMFKEYGVFAEISSGGVPVPYKPTPSKDDYTRGYIDRNFVKKVNENTIVEVQFAQIGNINPALYKLVSLRWYISGPKETIVNKNGVVEKLGVSTQNQYEIATVKIETGVDLSGKLSNLLEYWRGR